LSKNYPKSSKGVPFISSALFTGDPSYNALFPKVVETLVSYGGAYVPEYVERAGSGNRNLVIPFERGQIKSLFSEWESATVGTSWSLTRKQYPQVEFTYVKDWGRPFNSFSIAIESSYLNETSSLGQLLNVLKELYQLLHASYGFVKTQEMGAHYNKRGKEFSAGIDLKRGLPDIYWANFFGPEYVRMFGDDRIKSTPAYKIEDLRDSGVLLLLTSSVFDFDNDKEAFERLRLQAKQHLGIEAFDPRDWNPFETPDWRPQGRTPNFRFPFKERGSTMVETPATARCSDMLSTVSRNEWEKWLRNNESLALGLVHDLNEQGVKVDFSPESLETLDVYLLDLASRVEPSISFLMKLAAYLSQVVIRNTGATWSFEGLTELPELRVRHIHLSPLARTQKVLLEGETFHHWYQHLARDLASKPSLSLSRPHQE